MRLLKFYVDQWVSNGQIKPPTFKYPSTLQEAQAILLSHNKTSPSEESNSAASRLFNYSVLESICAADNVEDSYQSNDLEWVSENDSIDVNEIHESGPHTVSSISRVY